MPNYRASATRDDWPCVCNATNLKPAPGLSKIVSPENIKPARGIYVNRAFRSDLLAAPHHLVNGLMHAGADVECAELIVVAHGEYAVGEENIDQLVLRFGPDKRAREARMPEAGIVL